jgi:hypothetical protein
MNAPVQRVTISDVKVDHTPINSEGRARIIVSWIDGAGERQEIERHGPAADTIILDLHACTLMGESGRLGFLTGYIRCHTLRKAAD